MNPNHYPIYNTQKTLTNRFNRIKILIMYQISRQLLTGHYMIQNTHYEIGLIKLYITISRFEKLIK